MSGDENLQIQELVFKILNQNWIFFSNSKIWIGRAKNWSSSFSSLMMNVYINVCGCRDKGNYWWRRRRKGINNVKYTSSICCMRLASDIVLWESNTLHLRATDLVPYLLIIFPYKFCLNMNMLKENSLD